MLLKNKLKRIDVRQTLKALYSIFKNTFINELSLDILGNQNGEFFEFVKSFQLRASVIIT